MNSNLYVGYDSSNIGVSSSLQVIAKACIALDEWPVRNRIFHAYEQECLNKFGVGVTRAD